MVGKGAPPRFHVERRSWPSVRWARSRSVAHSRAAPKLWLGPARRAGREAPALPLSVVPPDPVTRLPFRRRVPQVERGVSPAWSSVHRRCPRRGYRCASAGWASRERKKFDEHLVSGRGERVSVILIGVGSVAPVVPLLGGPTESVFSKSPTGMNRAMAGRCAWGSGTRLARWTPPKHQDDGHPASRVSHVRSGRMWSNRGPCLAEYPAGRSVGWRPSGHRRLRWKQAWEPASGGELTLRYAGRQSGEDPRHAFHVKRVESGGSGQALRGDWANNPRFEPTAPPGMLDPWFATREDVERDRCSTVQ